MTKITVPLLDLAGNPMAFRRIAESHGLAGVAPWARSDEGGLGVTINTASGPKTLDFACETPEIPGSLAQVSWNGDLEDMGGSSTAVAMVRRMLGLERDLSPLLAIADSDPDLDWARQAGAGAMARGATAFEDVIRTVLTTNCSWALTVKMCELLVNAAGEKATGPENLRAFPTPEAMASLTEADLRDQVRVGYRAGRLRQLAASVATGEVSLEDLGDATATQLTDAELRAALLALPGIGPYAAAHIMLLFGRPAGVILDSWTRPKYARITGRKRVTDAQILKRVSRYGPDAGLALWLILSRDWFEGGQPV